MEIREWFLSANRLRSNEFSIAPIWLLTAVIQTGTWGLSFPSPLLGVSFGLALGWLTARQLAGSIEKKGEYRTTWKNWAVIALASILVVWAVFLTGIPFGILRIILSAVMWAPFAMYLGRLLYFSRWEKQKGKTIYFEGYFTTRFFATPRISPSMAWKDVPLERSR